jgi:hypothetical protein
MFNLGGRGTVLGVDGSVEVADGLKELGSSRSTCCARIPPFLLVGPSTNGGWWRGFSVMGPRLRPSELGSSKAESGNLPEALGDLLYSGLPPVATSK